MCLDRSATWLGEWLSSGDGGDQAFCGWSMEMAPDWPEVRWPRNWKGGRQDGAGPSGKLSPPPPWVFLDCRAGSQDLTALGCGEC